MLSMWDQLKTINIRRLKAEGVSLHTRQDSLAKWKEEKEILKSADPMAEWLRQVFLLSTNTAGTKSHDPRLKPGFDHQF